MLRFQEKRWRSLAPSQHSRSGAAGTAQSLLHGWIRHLAPTLSRREVSGPVDVHGGWGGISVPASSTALPPHASLQSALKTEKFVLVFLLLLLLLSSYEMSPTTESLNKSRLLKQQRKSASLPSPSQFRTFNLLRLDRKQRLCLFTGHRGALSTRGLSHLPNKYVFWGASWTGHDLSQITGHKLFLSAPTRAPEPIPSCPGTRCFHQPLGAPGRSPALPASQFT